MKDQITWDLSVEYEGWNKVLTELESMLTDGWAYSVADGADNTLTIRALQSHAEQVAGTVCQTLEDLAEYIWERYT